MSKDERITELQKEIRKITSEQRRSLENFTPLCPVDGLRSKYYQMVGSGQAGRPISIQYVCPRGDKFGWNFQRNEGYLIFRSSQASTPPETK